MKAKWILWMLFWGMACLPARALVLDWSTVSWTPGALTQSFDVNGDGVNDIQITLSGTTSALTASPSVTTSYQGVSALGFSLDFANTSGSLTVTITFLGVNADTSSYSLLGIDASQRGNSGNYAYQDTVSLSGSPTVTTGASVSYTNGLGTGTGTVPTSSANGNMNISYGSSASSISFTFGSSSNINSGGNPDPQDFALGNITFTRKLPEVGTNAAAFAICLGAVGWGFWRRRTPSRA